MTSASSRAVTKRSFEELSEFRHQLHRFLRFSEEAIRVEGITPLQYLLLLHIKGFPGRDWATVGELAARLQAAPNGVVALVSRCEEAGLVERRQSTHDHRCVEVHLRPRGEGCLVRLATLHKAELKSLRAIFNVSALSKAPRWEVSGKPGVEHEDRSRHDIKAGGRKR
jgi:DNA-binding MarR family transcriptional regulator